MPRTSSPPLVADAGGIRQSRMSTTWKLAYVIEGKADERLIDSYHDERAPVADENMQLSRRAAEFLNPSNAHSLAVRNAVLALAPRHPFAKVLINTGRLSVAPNLRGSWLLTPDTDSWYAGITPGNAAIDAPVGENGWLVEHLNGAFALMVYGRGPVPIEALVVLAQAGRSIGRIPLLHDRAGLLRKRYDLNSGAAYLFRPDQHVCARWRTWSASAVRAAVHRALGHFV
jgi:3-(3-hydroxy-phenyl)propionate hydroxylase